ncbi:MAG: hypothetical protein ACJ786_25695 [Catenulispora sp.]
MTVTVTEPPTPKPTPPPSTSHSTQAPAAPSAAAIVSAFYAAINAQDYAAAWKLGGDNLGSSYDAFAAGFAGTAHDALTITGAQGDTVQVHLEALQDDGTTKVYDGSYRVHNGAIVEGRLTQLTTLVPTAPPILKAPNGDFYRRGEYCPNADAGLTTLDANGSTLTCVFESGRYHWH